MDNLVELCRHHHRLLHEGGWALRPRHDGTWDATSPGGLRVRAAPGAGASPAGPGLLEFPALQRESDDGSGLVALSAGQRWELDLAVDAMLRWTTQRDADADADTDHDEPSGPAGPPAG